MIYLYREGDRLPPLPSTYSAAYILSRAAAYGCSAPFAPFYGDEKGNVLSILDGHAVLFCDTAHLEEWMTFLSMRSDILSLAADATIARSLASAMHLPLTLRAVMRLQVPITPPVPPPEEVSPREVYPLLQTAFGDTAPPFDGWYVDISHRIRHGLCHIAAIRRENQPVSAAMTVAECTHTAVIGGVATHPDHRRQGLAGQCVLGLAARILSENREKVILISPKNAPAERLYRSLGFQTEDQIGQLQWMNEEGRP